MSDPTGVMEIERRRTAYVKGMQWALEHYNKLDSLAGPLLAAIETGKQEGWDARHITEFGMGVEVVKQAMHDFDERHYM